jgi:hypothetical protein
MTGLADVEHAAGVAVEAVLDHGDVDVDDVARLEHLVAGNAVADLVLTEVQMTSETAQPAARS